MDSTAPNRPPHCPNCGRNFQPGRTRCQWCGADVSQVPLPQMQFACPCCEGSPRLEEFHSGEWLLYLCARCGGLWVTTAALERLEEHYEQAPASRPRPEHVRPNGVAVAAGEAVSGDPGPATGAAADVAPPALPQSLYRPCPQCRELMARRNYHRVSGVVLDECLGHGVWFDRHEFERVLAFLKSGGIHRSTAHDAQHSSGSLHDLFRIF